LITLAGCATNGADNPERNSRIYRREVALSLYLAVVIDLFNREVVGWSLGERIDRHLVIGATRMAVWKQKTQEKGINLFILIAVASTVAMISKNT